MSARGAPSRPAFAAPPPARSEMKPVSRPSPYAPSAAPALARPLWTMATLSLVFMTLDALSNHLTAMRHDIGSGVFDWERSIPFAPWTIVPYLSICMFFVASFFIGDERQTLDRHVRRLLWVLGISLACYALCPLRFTFPRPPTSGPTGLLFEALTLLDLPYNRAPSLHISVLLVLWLRFADHLHGWRRVALHAWFALIGVSVLTTYQHHVIDVPTGLAVGLLAVALTPRRLAPV